MADEGGLLRRGTKSARTRHGFASLKAYRNHHTGLTRSSDALIVRRKDGSATKQNPPVAAAAAGVKNANGLLASPSGLKMLWAWSHRHYINHQDDHLRASGSKTLLQRLYGTTNTMIQMMTWMNWINLMGGKRLLPTMFRPLQSRTKALHVRSL
jgi:hypothetical protein